MSTNDPNAKPFNPHTHTVTANAGVSYTIPYVGPSVTYGMSGPATGIPYSGYTSTGYSTSYATYSPQPDMTVTGTVKADDFEISGISMKDTLRAIQHRLAILDNPDPKKLEKYAALKEAYEQYKILEALIGNDDNLPKKE